MPFPVTLGATTTWPNFRTTRLGPFARNDDLYVVTLIGSSSPRPVRAFKSTNGGETWTAQNTAGETGGGTSSTLEVVRSGDSLYCLHRDGTNLAIAVFNMATDTWGSQISTPQQPEHNASGERASAIAVRGPNDIVLAYNSGPVMDMGTDYRRVSIRTYNGTWSSAIVTYGSGQQHVDFRDLAMDDTGRVYVFMTSSTGDPLRMVVVRPDNSLSAQIGATGPNPSEDYPVGTATVLDGEVLVTYRGGGDVKARRVPFGDTPSFGAEETVSTQTPATNATIAAAHNGGDAHVYWANGGDLWYAHDEGTGTWQAPALAADPAGDVGGVAASDMPGGIGVLYFDGGTQETGIQFTFTEVETEAEVPVEAHPPTATATARGDAPSVAVGVRVGAPAARAHARGVPFFMEEVTLIAAPLASAAATASSPTLEASVSQTVAVPTGAAVAQGFAPDVVSGEPPAFGAAMVGAVTQTGATVKHRILDASSAALEVDTDDGFSSPVSFSGAEGSDSVWTFEASGLASGTKHYYRVVANGHTWDTTGSFRTAPAGAASFTFAFASCAGNSGAQFDENNDRTSNAPTFDFIRERDIDFFLHMGDLHYQDITSQNVQAHRDAILAVLANSRQAHLYRAVALAYVWDDHEVGPNDVDGSHSAWPYAAEAYRDYIPFYDLPHSGDRQIYHTWTWGRVRFINLDVRSLRDPQQGGGFKSMLGSEQKQWLKDTLLAAEEPVIVLNTVVPWIASAQNNADHWGGYDEEREELASFFEVNGILPRLWLVHGDAHMLAADNGNNSNYNPGSLADGPPLACAAPMDCSTSTKGGSYWEGTVTDSNQQYGTIEVLDEGETITLTFRGWVVDTSTGTESEAMTLAHEFDAEPVETPALVEPPVAHAHANAVAPDVAVPAGVSVPTARAEAVTHSVNAGAMPPRLVASNGRVRVAAGETPFLLRGAHLHWFSHRFWSDDAVTEELGWVDAVVDDGANLVTFWVDTQPIMEDTTGDYGAADIARWWAYVDELVAKANERGFYVMFSWHASSAWDGHGIIDSDGIESLGVLAEHFAGNTSVLYATQSEPAGAEEGGTDDWTDLKPLMEAAVDAIRQHDPQAMIGIPGTRWSQEVAAHATNFVERANCFSKPHDFSQTPASEASIVLDAGIPVVFGEFGPRSNPDLMQPPDAEALQRWCEGQTELENMIPETGEAGYQGWALTPDGSPEMLASTDYNDLTSWGEQFLGILREVVSGLVTRYDALALTGLSNGDPVSQWDDLSGGELHATQSGTARPAYAADWLNGMPAVQFTAADSQYMDAPAFADPLPQPNTIVIVGQVTAASGTRPLVHSSVSNQRNGVLKVNDNWRLNAGPTPTGGNATEDPVIVVAVFDGADSFLRANGVVELEGDPGSEAFGGVRLGSPPALGSFLEGYLAEVHVYDYRLSLDEIESLEQQLSAKWFGTQASAPVADAHAHAHAPHVSTPVPFVVQPMQVVIL